MRKKTALITGTSSGLGKGLARCLLEQGWAVYGCSRRGCDLEGVHDSICDLTDYAALPATLSDLLKNVSALDLVILNAGILGEIQLLAETPLEETKQVMETNVWANKAVMDWLYQWQRPVGQVVMISSGAAVLGNTGWGGYALSKATLNMLAKLYAGEFSQTHISALAPGIIDTAMMKHLCEEADAETYPALKRLRQARGTEAMPAPVEAAKKVISVLPELTNWPSGSFIDIRQITDPKAYASLYGEK